MSTQELSCTRKRRASSLQLGTGSGVESGRRRVGLPGSRASRALRTIRRVVLAESGQSMFSFVRGLTLVLVAVVGGVFGAIWLAERGGPLQQKVDALVRKVDTLNRQPSGSAPADQKIRVTVVEPSVGPAKTEPVAPRSAPVPKSVRPTGSAVSVGQPDLPSLQAVHCSSQPGRTSVDIELGTATLAQTGRLHNPERVYFDLRDRSKPPDPPGRFGGKESDDFDDHLLGGIRMARSKQNLVRVVLDLKCACDHVYRLTLKPSPRLVVDLLAPAAGTAVRTKPAKTAVN